MRYVVFAFRQRKGEKISPDGDWPLEYNINNIVRIQQN